MNAVHASLAPCCPDMCPQDAAMKCLGTYIVKQTDMDKGFLDNIFAASASSSGDSDELDVSNSTSEAVALPGTAAVAIGELPPSLLQGWIVGFYSSPISPND